MVAINSDWFFQRYCWDMCLYTATLHPQGPFEQQEPGKLRVQREIPRSSRGSTAVVAAERTAMAKGPSYLSTPMPQENRTALRGAAGQLKPDSTEDQFCPNAAQHRQQQHLLLKRGKGGFVLPQPLLRQGDQTVPGTSILRLPSPLCGQMGYSPSCQTLLGLSHASAIAAPAHLHSG